MKKRLVSLMISPGAQLQCGLMALVCLGVAGLAALAPMVEAAGLDATASSSAPRAEGLVTFSKDIAPIVYAHCAICHHPGASAPFSLLTYADVQKRARQIAEVTQSGYMPPWPPEAGSVQFEGERRLTASELRSIQQWLAQGAVQGNPSDQPAVPTWPDGWLLGHPDLVLSLPEPYRLAAEGKDVYRNFVFQAPVNARRYVQAVEFRPGNPKVVHHAFIKVDRTEQSRHLDQQDSEPGFAGMNAPAEMPDGHFLTWQPGKLPAREPPGLAWVLEPGNDLVVQVHLRPSGKPEWVQPEVALYFTDQAPTNQCFKLLLTSLTVDIPPGKSDYQVEDAFVLPVEVEALAVLPHAHYLAKRMEGWARLPDGTLKPLLQIKDWDFNWQGDYRYAPPLHLPKGTQLSMRYTYDNSTNNVRNPSQPPQRVVYGSQSSDEMAELWLQLLPKNAQDLAVLRRETQAKMVQVFIRREEYLLGLNPADAKAHIRLAKLLLSQGRRAQASEHLHTAGTLAPSDDEPHYYLGLIARQQNRPKEALAEFESALRLNPRSNNAHGNLGLLAAAQGDVAGAAAHFRAALQINPDDQIARSSLDELLRATPVPRR